MLPPSIEAHKRATQLDPAIITSVSHTLFLAGEYASAIETYSGRAAYYLDAAAWAALGDSKRAITLLRERLGKMSLSNFMTALMSSLFALLEGRSDEAVRLMETADTTREPEILVYFARHYSRLKLADLAVTASSRPAIRLRLRPPHPDLRPMAKATPKTRRIRHSASHRRRSGPRSPGQPRRSHSNSETISLNECTTWRCRPSA